MNKRLAILSAVTMLTIGSVASCGKGYSYNDGVMLYIGNTAYTTNELFKSYGLDTSAGVKAYYDALKNVAIEVDIAKTTAMKTAVDNKIKNYKDAAASSAKTNGTTEAEELDKKLTADGFQTIEELEDSYYLEQKKTKADSNFYVDSQYNNVFVPEFIDSISPYHVRHILVKFDSDATSSIYQGTISKSDAEDIDNVVTRLAEGTQTFGMVALTKSEDTNSAALYGDVGIMSTKTSFVSEFKYGIYTYDAFFNPEVSTEDKAKVISKTFSSDATNVADYTAEASSAVYGIPYSAVKELKYYADKTTSSDGTTVKDAQAYNYPRNVIFNNYFNNHGLSFIYLDQNTAAQSAYYTDTDYATANSSGRFKTVTGISDKLKAYADDGSTAHLTTTKTVNGSPILCDETGRPILVARAGSGSGDSGYQGLHFIIVQKDPFTGYDTTKFESKAAEMKAYYSVDTPASATKVDTTVLGNTYVGFINTTNTQTYTDRASTLKTEVKKMDSNFDYREYEDWMTKATTGAGETKLTVTVDDKISTAVNSYITAQRGSTAESETRTYNTSWEAYLRQLKSCDYWSSRIIPVDEGIKAFLSNDIDTFNTNRAKAI